MTNLIGRDPRPLQKVFKNTSECFIQMFNNYACVETIKGEQSSQIPGIYDALYMFFFLQYCLLLWKKRSLVSTLISGNCDAASVGGFNMVISSERSER